MFLPAFLQKAFGGFRHPHPIYLVGGPIRDALLARPCHDWDFACVGARAAAKKLRSRLKAKLITLDDENKIYRLIVPSVVLQPSSPAVTGGGPAVRTSSRQIPCQQPQGMTFSGSTGNDQEGERLTVDFAELVGSSIEADLARRDFTVNAMAVQVTDVSGTAVIDPFGGMRDLRRRRLRAVSMRAFDDDPLRLLRAFRFQAQLGFTIDRATLRGIQKSPERIERAAPERIREELLRLLSQNSSEPSLKAMDQTGLLSVIFPELETCRRSAVRYYGRGGVLKHSLHTVANLDWLLERLDSKEWPLLSRVAGKIVPYCKETVGGFPRAAWLRLAGLLHDVGKPATAKLIRGRLRFFGHEDVGADIALTLMQRLRCSRQESFLIRGWVRNHMRPGNLAAAPAVTDKAIARFFRDLAGNAVGMFLVSLADHYDYLSKRQWGKGKDSVEKLTRRCLERYYLERQKVLPSKLIDGHMIMRALKLKPGPIIGKLLEAVQDAQAEGKVKTKEEAIAFLKKLPPPSRERAG
jgi:poly(A) polymerase